MNDLKIAIITVAGISSRFNKDIPENDKVLKCLYWEDDPKYTLLNQLIEKVSDYDKIIIVGGFRFSDLVTYISQNFSQNLNDKIIIFENDHYDDFKSGYSLYIGINEALINFENIDEILFVEGDLDIDNESFSNVVNSNKNVLTFNHEPIYSNKAVVLYKNDNDEYNYLFNSDHGNLTIAEPFKAIFNSGQVWKFQDMGLLKIANDNFKENLIEDTNLGIIQKYFDLIDDKGSRFIHLISMNHLLRFIVFDDRHNRFAQFLQYDLIIEFHYFQPLFVFLVLVQFVLVQHRSFHVYDMFLSIGSGAFHVIGTHFQTNAIGIIRTCST